MKRLETLFPGKNPVRFGATRWTILRGELRWKLGSCLNFLGVPGFVQPMEYYDDLTQTFIRVSTNGYFTVISINGKDFYFKRFTGKYDGSGMGV